MLRGSISRLTSCPQHSQEFRPQLPLPVIGLTTWLFGCFFGSRHCEK